MRNFFTHLLDLKLVFSRYLAGNYVCATPNQGTTHHHRNLTLYTRHRALRVAAMVTLLLTLACGEMWGATFVEKWQNGKNESTKDLIATFTLGSNASISSSRIQINNGNTGSFTWSVPTGYTITSVKFVMNSADSYVNTFTATNGSVSNTTTKEWTYTPSSSLRSETFSLKAQNGNAQISEVHVTFTDGVSDTNYESIYPGSADSSTPKNVTFTSSAATTSVTSLTTENGVNNKCVQVANGKKVVITASKNIKYILFSWNKYAPSKDSEWTANSGSYSKTSYKWTPANTTTKSVTFTRGASNTAEISNIHIVYYADAPCGSTAQAALNLSSSSGTICGTGTTTFTVSGGSGSGALSVSSSDETKATATIDGSTVTVTGVAAGSATITVTKACDATYAEKTATYSATVAAAPTANAGADKTTEPGEGVALAATAAASGCTGAWTIQSGPNTSTSQLSSTSSATATFTPTVAGTYTLRWTVTNTSTTCSAYDEMTVTAATCAISECGNATLTYVINSGNSGSNATDASDLISSATASNTTAMGISSTASKNTITISDTRKAAAATSACYGSAPNMSSKISMYEGAAYNSSNYLQFQFEVKSGYTFTPCDIKFTVQPVSAAGNFRWEVTDGTNVYGYGVAENVSKGSEGGASVMTGLGSTETMSAGTYYIRLYPYCSSSNTFRISNDVILKGTTATAGCASYSFHYGTDGQSDWTTTCFVTQGGEHEMQVTDFTIPSKTHFYVGKQGSYSGTSGNASDANSRTVTWSSMYFAKSIGDGTGTRPMLGQATGATGTIRIYDNSTWNNKQAAFIPDGYKLKIGSTEYAFTLETGNEYRSDIVELSSTNARSNISVGITNSSGNYVATDNTQEMQHLFLNTGGTGLWSADGVNNFGLYDITNSSFSCLMTKVPGEDYLYEGWVPSNCTQVIFVRLKSSTLAWGDANANVHNQTGDLTLESGKNYFTITNWGTGTWSTYEKKGKFRINDDWTDKNWYVRFFPYHKLTYDANGGSGAPAAAYVAVDAVPCQWTLSTTQPTRSGYTFLGWSTNSVATEPDAGKAVVNLGTPFGASGDLTLYAVWQCTTPTFGTNLSTSTVNYNQGASASALTVAATAASGTVTYQWYSNDENNTTTPTILTGQTSASYTPSTASVGTTYYYCVATNSTAGCSTTVTSNITPVTVAAAAVLTAMECNTLYKVEDMVPASITLSGTGQYAAGLSSNTYFEVIGDPAQTDGAAGTPEMKNESASFAEQSFTARMYLKGASNTTGSGTTFVPTSRAIKFIVPSSGTLDIYAHRVDRLYLKKAGDSGTTQLGTSTSGSGSKVSHDVTAGTYYIYANNTNTCIYGIKLNCCSDPVINEGTTRTSFAGGSWAQNSGHTITITATGADSYEWYRNTSATDAGATKLSETSNTLDITADVATGTYFFKAIAKSGACASSTEWGWCGAMTITAVTYTVTYNGNSAGGGSVPVDGSSPYTSGATVTVLGNTGSLTRTIEGSAATFYGWNTNSSGYGGTHYEAGNTFSISANTTLYAEWGYPITYNTDGGTINDLSYPTHYIYTGSDDCTTAALPTNVTKAGYTFDGWYTENGAGSKVTCIEGTYTGAFAEDYALKALWEEESDCEDLAIIAATSTSALAATVGSVSYGSMTGGDGISIDGYSYSVKFNSSGHVDISPKAGETFAAGDSLIVVIYNHGSSEQAIGFKIGSNDYTATTDGRALHYFRQTLVAANISEGKVILNRSASNGSSGYIVAATIKRCGLLPSCTTPTIPSLSDQTVCPGSDIAAWNATPSNASAISAEGESVSYSWKKKGSATELATTASFDLGSSATESQAGTYVVTVTVSKAGKASASASAEVDLTVTPATEEPSVSQSPAKAQVSKSVTLTATCGSAGTKTWSWHTCNSDGTGESSAISGATTNAYTFTAPAAAGTYYYKVKVTGDGTNACGTASHVYALTVAAASECTDYFWFPYATDATTNGVTNNEDSFFGASPTTGSSNSGTYAFTLDGTTYTATKNTGSGAITIPFTIPEGATASVAVNCKASSSSPLFLAHIGVDTVQVTNSSSYGAHTIADLAAGSYKLFGKKDGSGSWTLCGLGVHVCSASSCADATPTATATSTTVCSGTELSITATGYETSPTSIQWQKLNSSTSTWDNISGATSATYTVASAAAEHAGSYRVVVTKGCARTSNTVTIAVPSAPNFGSTVPASVSVMQTLALSISTVEATDAVKYRWYKSTDATFDAGTDTEIGSDKNLIKAYADEAIGSPSYYVFCRAQNACGITTSTAIAVNVTEYVEEDCATRGNEGDAEFEFDDGGCSQASYSSTAVWSTGGSNSKILTYTAPTGKYFKTAKVTIASSSENKASYNWSTNGGSSYTSVRLNISTTLTEYTIDLSAHGNVDKLQFGRNLGGTGSSSGNLYVSKICFEYTESCTATTVTPSTSSKTHTIGSAFTEPTFTVKHGGIAFAPQPTITYSSSNEDIATVDDDGTVTFQGMAGTVKITASYAGGTISATDYCASEGSYTITVSCSAGTPSIAAGGSTNISGCNGSVTLTASGVTSGGTYQWFRGGEEVDGATSASITVTQTGTYTVEYTKDGCTALSNSIIVTSESTQPEVERLVPFQYYHVDKTYTDQMKMRHLFAVKNSGTLDGKSFKLYVSRNSGAATDVTSSNALAIWPNADGRVDTVMIDLNKLSGKYSENDELVFTCKAIDCNGAVSDTYKATITMHVIGSTPTLALICSGAKKDGTGTRKTSEMTVGGDFLTGYNPADLCQQTGNTSFDGSQEWGLYTELKAEYIVTPVNGYAPFNKLNYEPFDILFLTDYPKASKSDAAKDILDDMAALCDYRPLFSFKTHMVAKSPSKWAAKGFTTSATENKADGRLNLNIVCYAHPMFDAIKTGSDVYNDTENTSAPLIYTMLSGEGYEGSKGMQGFEIAAAENFVTIGLTHYNGTIAKVGTNATWTPGSEDRMLVTVAERQTNVEARMILFSVNAGAHSKLTDKGEQVVLACLRYLLDDDPLHVADCSFTFDNGASNEHDAAWYAANCPGCEGTKGDGKWSTAANWGPDYRLLPGEFTSVRIKAPVEVDVTNAHVLEARLIEDGHITIPAGKALEVKSTIRRMDGTEISPTEVTDITIGSNSTGNGTLIFNNDKGDSKAVVYMYTTALADVANMSAATSTWQYIGTPHNDVASATSNYYDSWLYQYDTGTQGWVVIPNGGPLVPFRGYCVTHPQANHTFEMYGKLTATTSADIDVPAGKFVVAANSWVAPIDINKFTDDDFEGISDKTIYFFNTGSDTDGTGGTGTAAGTYRSSPIKAAAYTGDWQIPSMQGFYIGSTTAGTLHLDYDKHVRQNGGSKVSNPMYAPQRFAEDNEPVVAKLYFRGSRYYDRLVVLEREDFTRGYDSGWDGEAWGGNSASPLSCVSGEGRWDAVSAIPDFEGTVVGFQAGEDSEYKIDFEYSEENEPLYLLDTENNTYTRVLTGNAYQFTTSDKAYHDRFIFTRNAPSVITGIEPTTDSSQKGSAQKLLINEKVYILRNGVLYDATGKVVK